MCKKWQFHTQYRCLRLIMVVCSFIGSRICSTPSSVTIRKFVSNNWCFSLEVNSYFSINSVYHIIFAEDRSVNVDVAIQGGSNMPPNTSVSTMTIRALAGGTPPIMDQIMKFNDFIANIQKTSFAS